MADLPDRDFETIVFKILKELKEEVDEVRKMMCKQNGNTTKEIENLKKKKSWAVKYNNWNKKMHYNHMPHNDLSTINCRYDSGPISFSGTWKFSVT